jgi:hypothetical protein
MSIETVEIRAFSGPSVVEINGSDQPAIVEINQGPAGAAGPNSVTSATTSDGTANLSLSNVTTATATVTGTLTADHIHGNLAGSVYAHVRAGENLAKGDPVYISGSHGSGSTLIAIVSKADASDPLKMPAVGVMDAAVANNANGHMVITGTISDINTATYSVNAELYVAEGGGFTATPPSAYAQPVARVERSNTNNGAVIVKVNGLSASDATGNTLVRRTSTGGASFGSLTLTSALALSSGGTGGTTAGTARTNLGLGTADTPTFSNLTLNTGTITVPQPFSFSQTWNAAAMTFSAFQMNVTDTASASVSRLLDLRVGGSSRFNVDKSGGITATSNIVQTGGSIYCSGAIIFSTANQDVFLQRDATGTLAQRNGMNAQEFRLYGTYSTSPANTFERLNLKYNSTANAFQIGTEKGTGGGVARPLEFQTDGITRMTIATNGVLSTTTHANFVGYVAPAYLRLTGGTGEARIYKGTGDGSFAFYNQAENSRCIINVATDGVLKVRNIGNTDYAVADAQHRLQGTAPASATAAGTAGDIRYDSDYIYICTATNTWKRAAIATWP